VARGARALPPVRILFFFRSTPSFPFPARGEAGLRPSGSQKFLQSRRPPHRTNFLAFQTVLEIESSVILLAINYMQTIFSDK
jgi:hypothetical protein